MRQSQEGNTKRRRLIVPYAAFDLPGMDSSEWYVVVRKIE